MQDELKAYIDQHLDAAIQRTVEPLLRRTFASLVAHMEAVEMRNIERYDRIEARLDSIEARLDNLESRFENRFAKLEERLETLMLGIGHFEVRVLAEIADIRGQLAQLTGRVEALTARADKLEVGQVALSARIDRLADEIRVNASEVLTNGWRSWRPDHAFKNPQ